MYIRQRVVVSCPDTDWILIHTILIVLIALAMKLSKQSQSRLEESKVEKRIEDEEYLTSHQEIAAAIRVISRVRK